MEGPDDGLDIEGGIQQVYLLSINNKFEEESSINRNHNIKISLKIGGWRGGRQSGLADSAEQTVAEASGRK